VELEPSYTIGGNVKWCHYREHVEVPQIELPYNLAIPPLSIYLKKFKSAFQRGICTPVFMAALFTVAKI